MCNKGLDAGVTCPDGQTGQPGEYFYFNFDIGWCEQFSYLGCGGNGNKFDTMDACEAICIMQGAHRPLPEL